MGGAQAAEVLATVKQDLGLVESGDWPPEGWSQNPDVNHGDKLTTFPSTGEFTRSLSRNVSFGGGIHHFALLSRCLNSYQNTLPPHSSVKWVQDQLKRQGKATMNDEELQEFKKPTLEKYEVEGGGKCENGGESVPIMEHDRKWRSI